MNTPTLEQLRARLSPYQNRVRLVTPDSGPSGIPVEVVLIYEPKPCPGFVIHVIHDKRDLLEDEFTLAEIYTLDGKTIGAVTWHFGAGDVYHENFHNLEGFDENPYQLLSVTEDIQLNV